MISQKQRGSQLCALRHFAALIKNAPRKFNFLIDKPKKNRRQCGSNARRLSYKLQHAMRGQKQWWIQLKSTGRSPRPPCQTVAEPVEWPVWFTFRYGLPGLRWLLSQQRQRRTRGRDRDTEWIRRVRQMVQSRMRMRMRMLYAPYATCVDESHLKIEDIAGQERRRRRRRANCKTKSNSWYKIHWKILCNINFACRICYPPHAACRTGRTPPLVAPRCPLLAENSIAHSCPLQWDNCVCVGLCVCVCEEGGVCLFNFKANEWPFEQDNNNNNN